MNNKLMCAIATTVLLAGWSQAQDIAGTWQGTLQRGKGVRTVLRVSKADRGWNAVLYNIDQGWEGTAVTSITLQGQILRFSIAAIEVSYTGTLSADGATIAGSEVQDKEQHALNLVRVTPDSAWAIPGPPKPMAADADPGVEVATIKPSNPDTPGELFTIRGRHIATINTDVNDLIKFAYGLHPKQIEGEPAWLLTDKFDIDGVSDIDGEPNNAQMQVMMRKLLADRFKLTFHHEKKELAVYALTVAKNGPKLTKTARTPTDATDFYGSHGQLTVRNATMQDFATGLSRGIVDRPVVDQTGLRDRYDFLLKWTSEDHQVSNEGSPPGFFTAVQDELGLKLESTKALVDVVVIDHVEPPSAN